MERAIGGWREQIEKAAKHYGAAAAAPVTSFPGRVLSETSHSSPVNLQIFTPDRAPLPSCAWGHIAKKKSKSLKSSRKREREKKGRDGKGARCVVAEEFFLDKRSCEKKEKVEPKKNNGC